MPDPAMDPMRVAKQFQRCMVGYCDIKIPCNAERERGCGPCTRPLQSKERYREIVGEQSPPADQWPQPRESPLVAVTAFARTQPTSAKSAKTVLLGGRS